MPRPLEDQLRDLHRLPMTKQLPATVLYREDVEKANLKARGIRVGRKDSNNEFTTRQRVMTPKGAGLLNSVQFYRPKYHEWNMEGSVQFKNENVDFPLAEIHPLKFVNFLFQSGGFGLMGWVFFALLMVALVVLCYFGAWGWALFIVVFLMGATYGNFKLCLV